MSLTAHNRAPGDAGAPRDPYRHTVADDVLDSYGDRVTLQTVRGYASAHTPTSDDRHGARATQQTVGMVHTGSTVVLSKPTGSAVNCACNWAGLASS